MQIIPIARIDTSDICKNSEISCLDCSDFIECTKSRGFPWVSVGIRGSFSVGIVRTLSSDNGVN